MIFGAMNGSVRLGDGTMDYIRFGTGGRALVILPGLGDGLRTVKGTALPMAWMYRSFRTEFTVYMFSRREGLPKGYTTRHMARDQAEAMEVLGIREADVLGVSMGGMIAQFLAIDHPEKVGRLVLAVTAARTGPVLEGSIDEWVQLAGEGDHVAFMDSNVRRIYSDRYYRRNKWLVPVVGRLTKPASYERFFIQAQACREHEAYGELQRIGSPTLVIGGEKDLALGGEASRQIARRIPDARLRMYDQWGHGVYEEEPEFNDVVRSFLMEERAGPVHMP